MINWVNEMSEEQMETFKYQLSDPTKNVDVVSFENADKACRPMIAYSQEVLYGKHNVDIS